MVSTACPECAGIQLIDHPAGLVFQHRVDCELYRAEDATLANDQAQLTYCPTFSRPATTTEKILLAAAGHQLPESGDEQVLHTLVTRLTPGVRRRTWNLPDNDESENTDD